MSLHSLPDTLASEDEKPSQAGYKLIRQRDAVIRNSLTDQRTYYFDKSVDIVIVQSVRSHSEPAHLHTENIETYYVVQGRMLLYVEGEAILLGEGDLLTVFPGICHHFETFGDPLIFLAIKKEAGLDDKALC